MNDVTPARARHFYNNADNMSWRVLPDGKVQFWAFLHSMWVDDAEGHTLTEFEADPNVVETKPPAHASGESPRLRPGTYELTKRIEVGEDGTFRFVDMPDGPDAEYVAGFWHKTRSRVRQVRDGDTRVTPAQDITDEMIRRAGWDAFHAAIEGGYDSPQVYGQTLEAIIAAFTAGRVVVDLPGPDVRYYGGSLKWNASGRRIVARVDNQGRPYVLLDEQIWLDGEAESVGLALVAAAREARRLAVSPKGGETND